MKTKAYVLLVFIISLFSTQIFSEPSNLTFFKQQLRTYHDSGVYQNEIKKIILRAHNFVLERVHKNIQQHHHQKLAIVLDIDETSISNYNNISADDFGGNSKSIHKHILAADSTVIQPMLTFYKDVYKHGVSIFFVTGRHESERAATIKNLIKAGYKHWAGLYLKPEDYKQTSAIPFKSHTREEISNLGYTIIASIGDQESDLQGGYAEKTFKLPNPYYFVP